MLYTKSSGNYRIWSPNWQMYKTLAAGRAAVATRDWRAGLSASEAEAEEEQPQQAIALPRHQTAPATMAVARPRSPPVGQTAAVAARRFAAAKPGAKLLAAERHHRLFSPPQSRPRIGVENPAAARPGLKPMGTKAAARKSEKDYHYLFSLPRVSPRIGVGTRLGLGEDPTDVCAGTAGPGAAVSLWKRGKVGCGKVAVCGKGAGRGGIVRRRRHEL